MKYCYKCGEWKEKFEFHKNSFTKDNLEYICKKCKNQYMRNYNSNPIHKSKMKKYKKKYYQEHQEEIKRYREKYKSKYRNRALKNKFGITLEEYDKIFIEQNGCCAICGKHQSEVKRTFAVDHNHKTNNIRGLLCYRCNTFLGYCKDNINTFINAVEYLEKDGGK